MVVLKAFHEIDKMYIATNVLKWMWLNVTQRNQTKI